MKSTLSSASSSQVQVQNSKLDQVQIELEPWNFKCARAYYCIALTWLIYNLSQTPLALGLLG